jgi:hypothetical protein
MVGERKKRKLIIFGQKKRMTRACNLDHPLFIFLVFAKRRKTRVGHCFLGLILKMGVALAKTGDLKLKKPDFLHRQKFGFFIYPKDKETLSSPNHYLFLLNWPNK